MLRIVLVAVLAVLSPVGTLPPSAGPQAAKANGNAAGTPALALMGVLISPDTTKSIAVLKNESTGSTLFLKIGERASGFELVCVFDDHVTMSDGRRTIEIFFVREKPNQRERLTTPSQPPAGDGSEDPSISQLTAPVSVDKDFLKQALEKRIREALPTLLREARLVPHYEGGEIDGVRIVKWPIDSDLLDAMGIQEGDIIKRINEIRLKGLDVLPSLKDMIQRADRFDIVIERDGVVRRHSYRLW